MNSTRTNVPEVLKRRKCFIHIDLDCFFAQVEQIRLGLSADVPLVSQQWNAIIAVNYAARKFGITRLHHNVFDARLLCPELVCAHVATLGPGDTEPDYYLTPSRYTHKVSLDPYRKASAKIFSVFRKYCATYQKGGLDEVFMDVTDIVNRRIMDEFGDDLSKWDAASAEMINWARDHPEAGVVFGRPKEKDGASTTDSLSTANAEVILDDDEDAGHGDLDLGEGFRVEQEDTPEDREIVESHDEEDELDQFLSTHPDIDFEDIPDDHDTMTSAPNISAARPVGSSDTDDTQSKIKPQEVEEQQAPPMVEQEKSEEDLKREAEAEAERLRQEKEYLLPFYGIPEGTFEEQFWAEYQLLKAAEFCNEVRKAVKDELNYTCSAGIANNKLLAKLGSCLNKPSQQTIILPKHIPDLLHGLKLSKIRNLGGKFGKQVMTDYNIEWASQLWVLPLRELQHKYGEQAGLELWQWCRGIDHVGIRKIKSKSMCSHKSFIPALSDLEEIQYWITSMCLELVSRIQAEYDETERWPRTISLGFFGGIRDYSVQQGNATPTAWRPPNRGTRSMPFGSRFEYGGAECMARKMYGVVERLIKEAESGGRPILPLVILTVTVSNFAGGHGSALGDITKFFSKAPAKLPVSEETRPSVKQDKDVKTITSVDQADVDQKQDYATSNSSGTQLDETNRQRQELHTNEVEGTTVTMSSPEPSKVATSKIRKRFFEPQSRSSSPLSSPTKSLKRLQVASPDTGSNPVSSVIEHDSIPEPPQPPSILCNKCPSPGQQIPFSEWEEHADYHFAMSLLEDDRKQQQLDRQQNQSGANGGTSGGAKRSSSSGSVGSQRGGGGGGGGKRKKTIPVAEGSTTLARFFKPA
ncbi:DNA-directed DNA polymerase eta rad30 [Podila epigama]|nr:DNA-directed DNA polymerase eta rad30 [Podila epigama]